MKARHEQAISSLGIELQRVETARTKAKDELEKASLELGQATERFDMKQKVLEGHNAKITELQDSIDALRLDQQRQ